MLIFLATLLATLSAILRSCGALGLENLALRHQIGVLQRSARKRSKLTPLDRLLWACCRLLGVEHSAGPAGKTHAPPRSPRPDPQDGPRKPHLGCTPHPW